MVIREERLPAAPPGRASGPNRDFVLRRLLAAADAGGIVLALAISITFFGRGGALSGILWGLVTLPAWILIFKLYGLYDRDAKRVSHSTVDDLPWLFHALVIGTSACGSSSSTCARAGRLSPKEWSFFGVALVGIFVRVRSRARSSRFVIPPERVLLVGGGPMARASRAQDPSPSRVRARSDRLRRRRRERLGARRHSRTSAISRDVDLRSARRAASNASSSCRRGQPGRARRPDPAPARPRCPNRHPAPRRRRARPVRRGRRRRGNHRARHQPAGSQPLLAAAQARDGHPRSLVWLAHAAAPVLP